MAIETDILIIGSGFTASILAKLLKKKKINFEILDISEQLKVEYESNDKSFFDPELAKKTGRIFGGVKVWGNSVTFPSDKNFFSRGGKKWLKIGKEIKKFHLHTFIPKLTIQNNRVKKKIKKRLSKLVPNYNEHLVVEVHGYALGPSEAKGFENCIDSVYQGNIIYINDDAGKTNAISFLHSEGNVETIKFKVVVLASGTIGNALLVNRFTGAQKFHLGNHISTTIGNFTFKSPQNLNSIYQSFAKKEKSFVTFSLDAEREQVYSDHYGAVRLIPNRKQSLIALWKRTIDQLKLSPYSVPELKNITFLIIETVSRILFGKRLDWSYKLRLIGEIPLSKTEGLEVLFQDEFNAKIRVNLLLNKKVEEDFKLLIQTYTQRVANSAEYLQPINISLDLSNTLWNDSGHYFGTIPIGLASDFPTVDENLLLNGSKSIYVLGNSAHPVGSHGHPTGLSILLAARLAEHIMGEINA